jgi:hypothetical protein
MQNVVEEAVLFSGSTMKLDQYRNLRMGSFSPVAFTLSIFATHSSTFFSRVLSVSSFGFSSANA